MVPWCRELRKSQHFPAVDQKMLLKIEMWRNVKKCCQTELTKQRFVVCVVSIQSEFFPRGILNKVLYGHSPLWKGPTPYPFKNHFWRQKYPFRLSSIDKWYPFCDNTASHRFKRLLNRHFNLYQVPRRYKRNWIYNESSSTCKWNSTQGVKITTL